MRRARLLAWVVLLVLSGLSYLSSASFASAENRPRAEKRSRKASSARASRPAAPAIPIDPATVNDPSLTAEVGPGSKGGAVLRAQVLLGRAHFSTGEIDAKYGGNMRKAVAAFQRSRGISESGVVDAATWKALDVDTAPVLGPETIAPEDVAGPFTPIPEDMMEKAKLPAMGYASALEGIAEKHHASPALITALNPGASFDQAGVTIQVPLVAAPPPGKASQIVVSKSQRSVEARDAEGKTLAWYPATIGKTQSHGCIRLTNWDVWELQQMVDPGVPALLTD